MFKNPQNQTSIRFSKLVDIANIFCLLEQTSRSVIYIIYIDALIKQNNNKKTAKNCWQIHFFFRQLKSSNGRI